MKHIKNIIKAIIASALWFLLMTLFYRQPEFIVGIFTAFGFFIGYTLYDYIKERLTITITKR